MAKNERDKGRGERTGEGTFESDVDLLRQAHGFCPPSPMSLLAFERSRDDEAVRALASLKRQLTDELERWLTVRNIAASVTANALQSHLVVVDSLLFYARLRDVAGFGCALRAGVSTVTRSLERCFHGSRGCTTGLRRAAAVRTMRRAMHAMEELEEREAEGEDVRFAVEEEEE